MDLNHFMAITPKAQMTRELREIVSKYGFQHIHTTLLEIMKQEYEFLSNFFLNDKQPMAKVQKKQEELPAVPGSKTRAEAEVQGEAEAASEEQKPQLMKKGKMTTVKVTKETKTALEAQAEEAAGQAQTQTEVQVQTPSNTESQAQPQPVDPSKVIPKFDTPQEQKAWQKEQEEAKRQELEAQGINPKSLMTKENLKRWVEEEKNSYAWVARNVGIPEHKVSNECKRLGVQSDINKRRGVIIGAKSKGKA